MRRLLAFTLVAAGFAACSSYGEDGDSPSPPADAGADGAVNDAPSGSDGGDEASADAGADGACPGVFCDGFENGSIGAKWNAVNIDDGTIEITTMAKVGARAMHVTKPTSTNTTGRDGYLDKTLPVSMHVACTFWFRIETTPPDGFTDIAAFRSKSSAAGITSYSLILSAHSGGLGLREDVSSTDAGCLCPRKAVDVTPISAGTWMKLRFDFDFQKVRISKDDTLVFEDTFGNLTPDQLTFGLGLIAYTKSALEVGYDELVCEEAP